MSICKHNNGAESCRYCFWESAIIARAERAESKLDEALDEAERLGKMYDAQRDLLKEEQREHGATRAERDEWKALCNAGLDENAKLATALATERAHGKVQP